MNPIEVSEPKYLEGDKAFGVSAVIKTPDQEFDLQYRTANGPFSQGIEPYLAVTLLPAMKLNAPIHLPGPTSPRLLGSIPRIEDIFHTWDRNLQPVRVISEPKAVTSAAPGRGVACFFSGGIDSFYTVMKNLDEIDKLIFVNGFDIRLADRDVWTKVIGPIRAAAAELGKPLVEIETNIYDFATGFYNWFFYFGSAMASVSHLLSPYFRKIYFPATHTYTRLLPVGSHPLLDPLWSTEEVEIVHDGCEATRIEKAAFLGRHDTPLKYLRVCYHNKRGDSESTYNCGHCEKCLRTKINLYLAGVLDRCTTIDHTLDLNAISRLRIRNERVHSLNRENLEAAERTGANKALIRALQYSLKTYPPGWFGGIERSKDRIGRFINSRKRLSSD